MKKLLCGVLSIVLALGCFVGCSARNTTDTMTSRTDYSRPSASEASSEEDDKIPSFIKDFYQKYSSLAQENNFGYTIVSSPEPTGKENFSFGINLDSGSTDFEVTFSGFEGTVDKSFELQYLNKSVDVANVRDYITATFLSTDSSLTPEEAKEKMQMLINSYTGEDFSSVEESGEYLIFIEPFGSNSTIIHAKHKDEILSKINKNEYENVDFSSYNAPKLNKGAKVYVKGTVVDHERQNPGDSVTCIDYITIKASDGNEYRLSYHFFSLPVEFENGESYTFYGNIAIGWDDDPSIAIHYYE